MASSNHRVVRPGRRRAVSTKASQQQAEHPLGEYMVPGHDSLGRSTQIKATVAPELRRMASALVAKSFFGFKTEADVVRWCLHTGMEILAKRSKDSEIIGQFNLENAWVSVASKQMEHAHYADVFKGLAKAIDNLIDMGHASQAELIAEQVWKGVDRLDEPYWQPRFRTMAKKALDKIRKKTRESGNGAGDD